MPLPGFPAPAGNAEISILGGVHLYAAGGTLAFTDASGEAHALRTGNWSDDPATVTRRDVFFEGTLGSASIPAGPRWGIGAPGASWRFDGEIAWTDATGEARANGTTKSFSHEDVRARGSLLVEPDPAALGSEARYRASGDVQTLTIGGAPLVAPRGAPTAALVGASLLALAAALAGGLALYTRLAAADLLAHPQRARICRAAEIEPGIHLRELHRRAGGGWGAFRAHLHLLRRGGHLRVERRGRYALVFPARVAPQAAIPHPLARAVYDALPDDGSPLPLVALRERVGTTRQLLNYHAGRLEAAGLITLTRSPRGRRAARARLSTPSIRTTGT
jgi:DNA-binding transcriptional ArsR family regulator